MASILDIKIPLSTVFLVLTIITLQLQIIPANSQQEYVNNHQLDCYNNFNSTNGYICNSNQTSCPAYITFRSSPNYNTAPNIEYLLNSNASAIAELNDVSDVDQIPEGRLLVIPVTCSCTTTARNSSSRRQGPKYFQHNTQYTLKKLGEIYLSISNDTYQGLTTCQAMMAQNPYDSRNLSVGQHLLVPLMCACPTSEQVRKYKAKYLVSYLIKEADNISQIADMFGVDEQSVLDANELKADSTIFPHTPILVPLKSVPTKINLSLPPPALSPQSNSTLVPPGGGGISSKKWVYIGMGIGVAGMVLLSALSAWFFFFRPSRKPVSPAPSKTKVEINNPESTAYTPLPGSYSSGQETKSSRSVNTGEFKVAIESLTVYKFKELEAATEKFSERTKIKGSVFQGKFKGDSAAIKIMKGRVPTDEINLLKHINHSNIIRLSGYCIHEENTYLVYEYAEKGSLDDWLFRQQKHPSDDDSLSSPILGWKQRVQIVSNVADALNYLHSYINPPYVHKNLKSSNILLDSTYKAKITNFGLARTVQEDESGEVHMTKHVVGTHGYLAPEYIENGVVTAKLDVFAFGVIVLEVLSGKPAVRPSGLNNGGSDDLLFIAIGKVFEGDNLREKLMGFIDSNLGRAYPLDLAYSMAQLAHKCVERDMNFRPSMSEVSMMLSKIYSSSLDWDPSDELANSSSLSHSH